MLISNGAIGLSTEKVRFLRVTTLNDVQGIYAFLDGSVTLLLFQSDNIDTCRKGLDKIIKAWAYGEPGYDIPEVDEP